MAYDEQTVVPGLCAYGVRWNASVEASRVVMTPQLMRWDAYYTEDHVEIYTDINYPEGTIVWSFSDGYDNETGSGWRDVLTASTLTMSRGRTEKSVRLYVDAASIFTAGGGSQAYTLRGNWYYTVPRLAPSKPTGVAHSRNANTPDNRNDVSWTIPGGGGAYTEQQVYRSVNGGGFSLLATIAATATSYSDKTCQTDCSYSYKVAGVNGSGSATSDATATTYNTPKAPDSIATRVDDGTTVGLTFGNTSDTASALELQCTQTPNTEASWAAATGATFSGTPVTEATHDPGGGTWYYRARNTRGTLKSAWVQTKSATVTECPPDPPVRMSPASGCTVKAAEQVVFSFTHSAPDRSLQTAAQVRYSTDGGATYTTVDLTTQASYTLPDGFAQNVTVTWGARTKGADADWGGWASSTFYVKASPTPSITDPATDGSAVSNVPLEVEWSYSDASGTQRSASVAVEDAQGNLIASKSLQGTGTAISFSNAECLLENNRAYAVVLTVTSTSTLATSTRRTFYTDYIEPPAPQPSIYVDPETYRVSLSCAAGAGPSVTDGVLSLPSTVASVEDGVLVMQSSIASYSDGVLSIDLGDIPDTSTVSIHRRNADGSMVCLVDDGIPGVGVVDMYPPLDTEFSYIFSAYSENGQAAIHEVPCTVPSKGAVVFDFGDGQQAALFLNMAYDHEVSVEQSIFDVAGRESPLVFYGERVSEAYSLTGTVFDRLDADPLSTGSRRVASAFVALGRHKGTVVMRRPHRDKADAVSVTVSGHADLMSLTPADSVTVSARVVSSDGLEI